MRKLRIVFMGSPDFAVASLRALVEADYEVVGVITAPDRPAGRGRKLKASAVKQYAVEQQLPVLQPTNLKDPEFLAALAALRANLQVVVAFRMLPEAVWKMPEYGTFNLHASLLPQYRGAAPIHWAVINGEEVSGVTTFFIDEKIDTGAILMTEATEIGADETTGELHDRLMALGAELVIRTVALIADDKARPTVQSEAANLKKAPKLNRENCKINWEQTNREVFNKIRGLNPYPGAWTILRNGPELQEMKIFRSRIPDGEVGGETAAIVVEQKRLLVVTGAGPLELLEVQLSGKKRMRIQELLNGYKFTDEAHFV